MNLIREFNQIPLVYLTTLLIPIIVVVISYIGGPMALSLLPLISYDDHN